MSLPLNWTERELGDWEACVAASGLTALVYGGWTKFPLGIYTKEEREAIEEYPDEPLGYPDWEPGYTVLDRMTKARYGIQLRKLSTGTISDAVTRVGVGLLLAGRGSPGQQWSPNFVGGHSVFYVPTSRIAGVLFDPLAPDRYPGENIAASRIVTWAKGAGPNDAREVKENEFTVGVPFMIEALQSVPAGSVVNLSRGVEYQFWGYNATGERSSWAHTYPADTSAPTSGIVDLLNEPPAYFIPKIWDGTKFRTNQYLATGYASMSSPVTPADCSAVEEENRKLKVAIEVGADKLDEAADEIERLNGLIEDFNAASAALTAEGQ